MTVHFMFSPQDYVTVTLFGLNFEGRVAKCVAEQYARLYEVYYAGADGAVRTGQFYEDELQEKKK